MAGPCECLARPSTRSPLTHTYQRSGLRSTRGGARTCGRHADRRRPARPHGRYGRCGVGTRRAATLIPRRAGSHESYVRCILAPVCTPVEQGGLGYRGVVVNFRGCECASVSFRHSPCPLPRNAQHAHAPLLKRRCGGPADQPAAVLGPPYRRHPGRSHVPQQTLPARTPHRCRLLARGQCAHAVRRRGGLLLPARGRLRARERKSTALGPPCPTHVLMSPPALPGRLAVGLRYDQ